MMFWVDLMFFINISEIRQQFLSSEFTLFFKIQDLICYNQSSKQKQVVEWPKSVCKCEITFTTKASTGSHRLSSG